MLKNERFSCFPMPHLKPDQYATHSLVNFFIPHSDITLELNLKQQNALSHLVPLFICGEQSAVHIFHQEAKRLKNNTGYDGLSDFLTIETDEYMHEQALQRLASQLPIPENLHQIKRRTQIFYTRLQRLVNDVADHFLMISELDACTCVFLDALISSSIAKTRVAQLFEIIKKDEARHVGLARRHAFWLCDTGRKNKVSIHEEFIQMLNTETDALKAIDIDVGLLFNRIRKLAEKVKRYKVQLGIPI